MKWDRLFATAALVSVLSDSVHFRVLLALKDGGGVQWALVVTGTLIAIVAVVNTWRRMS